ncbi:MAG: hypothetical protein KJZ87_01245, partial [Thermoguttaceae bacterium]|nr:hypothetical protein [Thermoguttaceae bacterium]
MLNLRELAITALSAWLGLVTFAAAPAPVLAAPLAVRPLARFEPPDGKAYHGVCLPGYWKSEEFAANLAAYRKVAGEQSPLVLHSWFAHCQENGKWRTWHWMNETPDGGRSAGAAENYAHKSRQHGLVPLIAWTWMEYPDC